jgi:hypothetical protein
MSYISPDGGAGVRLQIAEITLSGSPSANGYFTFSTLVDHTFDTAPTGLNSATLTLPAGSYMFRAVLDITRTSSNQNYEFQFEVAGSLAGRKGQTGLASDLRSDVSEAVYKSSTSFDLKIEALAIENSAPTLTTGSKCFIWRTE